MAKQNPPAKKAAAKKKTPVRLPWRTSEVLYGFAGWLTTRKEPLTFGAEHGAAPIAEIVGRFIDVNGIPRPRDRYPKFKIPDDKGLTNVSPPPVLVNVPTKEEARQSINAANTDPVMDILMVFNKLPQGARPHVLREVLSHLQKDVSAELGEHYQKGETINIKIKELEDVEKTFARVGTNL